MVAQVRALMAGCTPVPLAGEPLPPLCWRLAASGFEMDLVMIQNVVNVFSDSLPPTTEYECSKAILVAEELTRCCVPWARKGADFQCRQVLAIREREVRDIKRLTGQVSFWKHQVGPGFGTVVGL